jgi:hypothetical protein
VKSFTLAQELGVDFLNFNHLRMQTDQMVQEQQNLRRLHQSGRVLWQVSAKDIDSSCVFESIRAIRKMRRGVLVSEYLAIGSQGNQHL